MQCPFCKEEIQDGAIKCKHCGSMLTAQPNNIQPIMRPNMPSQSTPKTEMSKATIIWGWILSSIGTFIVPFFAIGGITIGIMSITKAKTGRGVGMIVVSIIMAIFSISFWEAFWPAFNQALNP